MEWEWALKAKIGKIHDHEATEEGQDNIYGPPTSPSTYLAPSSSSDAVSLIEEPSSMPTSPRGSPGDRDAPQQLQRQFLRVYKLQFLSVALPQALFYPKVADSSSNFWFFV